MSLRFVLVIAALSQLQGFATEAHDIYSHLTDSDGQSCCNDRDCRPAPYRMTPAGVQMYVDGSWIEVPEEAIQYRNLPGDTGETDGGHWCGWTEDAGTSLLHVTRCAILPPEAADTANGRSE